MKRIIVTSALPYINGVKHLGNLIGSMLPADVYARFQRMCGHDVIFICGTDEHGTPAELGAEKEGLTIEKYAQKYHDIQSDIYKSFNLSFDYFGRTSSLENHEITQQIFLELYENGYIIEKETAQIYSTEEGRFLPDRYVSGTCPICHATDAKGDQCEACSTLLNPSELIDPKSVTNEKSKLELRNSKHLYLDLCKLTDKISMWVNEQNDWPPNVTAIAKKWINEGLKPRGITRDLKWGIPVPLAGYESKVFYVWFDAPIGYIGISKQWANAKGEPNIWENYWRGKDTQLVQFMAKDNVPFHTIFWPATLIGANNGFILPTMIKGLEWLQYEGGKFSTSSNRGIFTNVALELFPADYWRYYLLKIAPEKKDADFTWEGFQEAVNKDLADALGNFMNRTLTFLNRKFNGIIPNVYNDVVEIESHIQSAMDNIEMALNSCKFGIAVKYLRGYWQFCNQYMDYKAPYKVIRENHEDAHLTMGSCVFLLKAAAVLSAPFIPHLAKIIYDNIGIKSNVCTEQWSQAKVWEELAGRKVFANPKPLIQKITDDEIDQLGKKYSGTTKQ